MADLRTLELPISGMDCAECTQHVQHAIETLPGVQSVSVFLATEKAIVRLDPNRVDLSAIRTAVQGAGYDVPASASVSRESAPASMEDFNRRFTMLLATVFVLILSVVILGEGLGIFDALNERIPFWIGLMAVLASGYHPQPHPSGATRRPRPPRRSGCAASNRSSCA